MEVVVSRPTEARVQYRTLCWDDRARQSLGHVFVRMVLPFVSSLALKNRRPAGALRHGCMS